MERGFGWKRMGMLLLLLPCLLLGGCGGQREDGKKEFRIVTSFYPVYIDVINIAKGIDGVSVVNMTKPQTGCLHDYQLTTEDMKTLESADAFVINGGGMESFMEKAMKQNKDLKVVDASFRPYVRNPKEPLIYSAAHLTHVEEPLIDSAVCLAVSFPA